MSNDEFTIAEDETAPTEWPSPWKAETPEQVLVLIHNKEAQLLGCCGSGNAFEAREGELCPLIEDEVEHDLDDGLWILEGTPRYFTCSRTGVIDVVWGLTGQRRLTDQEWEWYKESAEPAANVWPDEWRR